MNRACLAGLEIGDGRPVALVGAINLSPESFYAGSVSASRDTLLRTAEAMVIAGAALLDVGAMSTAPYRDGAIEAAREADRLGDAIQTLVAKLDVPVSADTSRTEPARAALQAGARVINDVRGLTGDPALARLVAESGAGLILMASERGGHEAEGSPTETVLALLGALNWAVVWWRPGGAWKTSNVESGFLDVFLQGLRCRSGKEPKR